MECIWGEGDETYLDLRRIKGQKKGEPSKFVFHNKYYLYLKWKLDGNACSSNGGKEICIENFIREREREKKKQISTWKT